MAEPDLDGSQQKMLYQPAPTGFVSKAILGADPACELEFAYPTAADTSHCLNVLCGSNASGKSYLLRMINACLTGEKILDPNVIVVTEGDAASIRVALLDETWYRKRTVGVMRLAGAISNRISDEAVAASFFYSQVLGYCPGLGSESEWMSAKTRANMLRTLNDPMTLRRCQDKGDGMVNALEEILGGSVSFRRKRDELELVHLTSAYYERPFVDWSDGQKTVLYVLARIALEKPSVLLIDELENHLHPEYMTTLLGALKVHVPQILIATHHPHLIFSRHADRVLFLELASLPGQPLPRRQARIPTKSGMPPRRVVPLVDDFEKLAFSYKLFDTVDVQLLRQASTIMQKADIAAYEQIAEALGGLEVEAGPSVFPDAQSATLADELRREFSLRGKGSGPIRVLDFGAGKGRTALEASKVSRWMMGGQVEWILWHPTKAGREELRGRLTKRGITCVVPESLVEVPDGSIDLIVLSNVLHELTIAEFVALVGLADAKAGGVGRLAIFELYPLLGPERFAVPYPEEVLRQVLSEAGLKSRSARIPMKGVSSYCLLSERKARLKAVDQEALRSRLLKAWQAMRKGALESYSCFRKLGSFKEFMEISQELMIVASVTAHELDLWGDQQNGAAPRE